MSRSDANTRHGAFDFYEERLTAPDDLKRLTDNIESMAFRRRGYVSEPPRRVVRLPESLSSNH